MHDYKQYKNSFETSECFEIPNCIYLRFEGSPNEIDYAHSKLDLYFYESDLEPTGETYSVMVEDSEYHSVVDIFKPVMTL